MTDIHTANRALVHYKDIVSGSVQLPTLREIEDALLRTKVLGDVLVEIKNRAHYEGSARVIKELEFVINDLAANYTKEIGIDP